MKERQKGSGSCYSCWTIFPSFFLGTSLQSRRARHANRQCLQSAVPGIDIAQSGRQGHRNAETSRWLRSLESKEVYFFTTLGGVYKVKWPISMSSWFIAFCIPKWMWVHLINQILPSRKKKIGYVNPPILSEFRHEPAVWHRSDHCVFGCQPKSSNQLHLKNCNSCPPSKPSARNSDGHPVSLNF